MSSKRTVERLTIMGLDVKLIRCYSPFSNKQVKRIMPLLDFGLDVKKKDVKVSNLSENQISM
jgi:hypothetical protein